MKPYEIRQYVKGMSKKEKEDLRHLVEIKTMDSLVDMKNLAIEEDRDEHVKFISVALYLRAFFEGGIV